MKPELMPPIDGPVIQTVGGRYVNPLDLQVEDIDITDIAHALANQCRFSGHVREFYSVAEHSVRVAEILEESGQPLDVILQGLLHDASEAYLIDVPRPLKSEPTFGDAYLEAEAAATLVIFAAFQLPAVEPPEIKAADNVMLATERRDLMPRDGRRWLVTDDVPMRAATIRPWSPRFARAAFLNAFHSLEARIEAASAMEVGG